MPAKAVGVLLLHGMGSQQPGYAAKLTSHIRDALKALNPAPLPAVIQEGFWADLLSEREADLWQRMRAAEDLDFSGIRQFVISAMGDAIAYRPVPTSVPTTYHQIHIRVYECLERLQGALPPEPCPLVVVGHSLGSVILSDHIWDEQQQQGHGRDAFTRGDTLAGFVSFGSTLPLFTLGLEGIVAISFPGPALTPAQRAAARWLNFFDKDDVLGYPLKPTAPSYGAVVSRDIQINVGNIFSSWNPACHTAYWDSVKLAHQVAELIDTVGRA